MKKEKVKLSGEIYSIDEYITGMTRSLKEVSKQVEKGAAKDAEYKRMWLIDNLRGFGESALEHKDIKTAIRAFRAAGLMNNPEILKKISAAKKKT